MGLKDRRIKRILFLAVLLVVLVGCKANIDTETGQLIADRIIDSNTKWSFSQGWFDFLIVMPIAKLILLCEGWMGIVASIIAVTILVNLVTLPMMIQSTVMSQKMNALQPQIERIQNKYRGRSDQNSQMRMSAEISALYKKHDIKMGRTMLLPFLSLPIMIAMWQAVQRIPSVYEATFCGLSMGAQPMDMIKAGKFEYIILVVILGITQYLSVELQNILQKKNPNYKAPKNDNMKYMSLYMLVMMVFFSLNMPAAMSIYLIVTSLIAIARAVYIHYAYTLKGNK